MPSLLLTISFPGWLSPEIIPGLPFRWYSLMYIAAFGTAFLLYRAQVRERRFPMRDDELSNLFFCGILALIIGARVFSVMVYEQNQVYQRQPWLVFWPFQDGRFTGLQGMSYHGGVIGGILAILIYSGVKRFDYREIGDMFAASIPLGYTFGRLGNFANGELYGRVSTGPWGMVFPFAQGLPAGETWVKEAAAKAGIAIQSASVNLPRHPSQLYEAFLEGVLLWLIIWLCRNRKPFKGFLIGLYLMGYGIFRFAAEYFREPDAKLGYRIQFIETGLPAALSHPPFSFSTGQVFSFAMFALGLLWLVIASRLPDHKPKLVYLDSARAGAAQRAETAAARKGRRKLQRKLR
ncbi:MAG: prolipoprotein diacylglyceryl transferase [Spirochaetaceae bacterium]|jgi:phosphatidylglycerol:prolipoprotein diacylglycerol transferase|nr:prolipoprotein diacylglyceryl transferase [Spirochaetaceae bacterium]